MKKIILILLIPLLIITGLIFFSMTKKKEKDHNILPSVEKNYSQEDDLKVVAKNLDIPWELEFLPDKSILLTQRSGSLIRIANDYQEKIEVEGVRHVGEGGLLGLALDPNFKQNQLIYIYITTQKETELINRVERYHFDLYNNSLSDKKIIIDDIPGALYHDGGRIAFGPDGFLYITTGDAGKTYLAQDTQSLAGKILRVNKDGTIPDDNPFSNPVYSYGHRNPQGLSWDQFDRLWATEHGPSGSTSGRDELNLIEKGKNYGWPEIIGAETKENMISPVIQSGADNTWAPAGLEIIDDQLFFVGLRGASLYQAEIKNNSLVNLTEYFKGEFGRLRIIKKGPDNWLYLATSNQDGRGDFKALDDDKLIKINPKLLE